MPGSVGSRAPVVVLVAAAILAGAPGEAAAQGTARDVAASREAGEQLAALRARVIAAREALPGLGGEERDAAWRALSGAAAWSRAVALQPGAPAAEEGAESRRAAERRVAAELSPHLYAVERAEVVVDSLARLAGDSDPLVRAATVESAALLPDGAGLAVLRSRLLALAAPWLPSAGERPALGLGLATPSRRPGSAREESEDGLAGARPRPTMEQAKEFRALAEGFGRVGGPETIGPLLFLLRDLPDPAANETAARQLRTLRFDAPGDEDAIRAAEAGLSPAGGDLSAHLVARRTMLLTRAQALAAAGDHERRVEAARHLAIFGPGEPARTAAALAAAGARNPGGAGVEPGTGNPGETGGVGEASEVERARALLTRAEPNRDLMRRLADDPHPAVRRQAMEALGWWGLADDARVIADRFVGDARRRLADGRERLAAFPEPDPETRVTAARAVAAIGDDAGAPALFFLLDNGGDRARIEAARALARMRFPAAPELRAFLPPRAGAPPAREAGALARMEVCRALGQIGHDNADAVRGPLIAALEDEDPGVARNAA
ncbi:MAG: hypothetical protein HY719_16555, partial [Planctomycetes bacterium]|nr:hypothetical protein [Planctomycetota bacterium]